MKKTNGRTCRHAEQNLMKRFLAVALTLAMILTSVDVNLFAAENPEETEKMYVDTAMSEEAVSDMAETAADADLSTDAEITSDVETETVDETLAVTEYGELINSPDGYEPIVDSSETDEDEVSEDGEDEVSEDGEDEVSEKLALYEKVTDSDIMSVSGEAVNKSTANGSSTSENASDESAADDSTSDDSTTDDSTGEEITGTCGTNVTYSLNTGTGELVISGTGDMMDATNYYSSMPFYSYREYIKTIVVEEGVTSIGKYAFYDCEELISVSLPDTITKINYGAFRNCIALTSIVIPSAVETIGDYAFEYDTALTSVTFPEGLVSIGGMAFYGCSSLEAVSLPNTLISLDYGTFWNCTSLSSLKLSNSMTGIAESAFYLCSALTEVTIPESVTEIGDTAFRGTGLTSVTIPGTVKTIGDYAFSDCSSMTSLTIEEGVVSVGDSAFARCKPLTTVSLPNSLIEFGSSVFLYTDFYLNMDEDVIILSNGVLYEYNVAEDETDIVLPDSVRAVAGGVFKNDTTIETITLPAELLVIGASAFEGCTSLTMVSGASSLEKIGDSAFEGCTSLTGFSCGSSLEAIGAYAFYGCTSLVNFTYPDTISFVGSYALGNTSYLENYKGDMIILGSILYSYKGDETSVIVPEGITSISDEAFAFHFLLESVELPETLESIGDNAFLSCHSLKYLIIPENVTDIGEYSMGVYCLNGIEGTYQMQSSFILCGTSGSAAEAYADEYSIDFIALDEDILSGSCGDDVEWMLDINTGTLTIFGTGSMTSGTYSSRNSYVEYVDFITNIVVEEGVTSLGNYAFYQFTNLKSVSLPSTLTGINNYSFGYCTKLVSVSIPASVTSVGSYAFTNCIALQELNVEEGNTRYTSIDGVLYNKAITSIICYPQNSSIEIYEVPSTITVLGAPFSNAYNLRCVIVPDSVVACSNSIFNSLPVLEKVVFLGDATYTTQYSSTYSNFTFKKSVSIVYDSSAGGWTSLIDASTYSDYISWVDMSTYVDSSALQIGRSSDLLQAGETMQLEAKLNPELAVFFEWSSSDSGVARVTGSGLLVAVSAGTTVISCTSEDGNYTAEFTLTVTGEAPAYSVTEGKVAELDASMVGTAFTSLQIPCEDLQGIYFLNDNVLYFYSLVTETYETVNTFFGCVDAYEANGFLYILTTAYKLEVYDLAAQSVARILDVEEGYYATAVGADSQGRIYIAGYEDGNSTNKRVFLYSSEGELLSYTASPTRVYAFLGFDEDTGYFFTESYVDFYYWGYQHPGRGVTMGVVKDDVIERVDTWSSFLMSSIILITVPCLEYLYQSSYYVHQDGAAVLGDRYLVTRSVTLGRVKVMKISDTGLSTVMSLARSAIEYDLSSTSTDTTSVGVRAVYNEANNSIIMYDNDRTISEYDMDTGNAIAAYNTAYYVYSLSKMGDSLVIIEKEDDVYYMEIVDWSLPSEMSIITEKTTMAVGEALQLSTDINLAYEVNCEWTSSDDSVASVTDSGRVVAWSEGTVTITASILDGALVATIQITVEASDIMDLASGSESLDGTVSNNISDNNYAVYYASNVYSYLVENEDGTFTRVEYISGTGVLVEKYSSDHELVSSTTLEAELSIFGGFYAGDDYNFLVFGQSNTSESDEVEVMRIVKYDKNWNRISQCSIYGANTYNPFEAGSLRMTETAGLLYIHTCHKMYTSSDGLNHQANMTYVITESDMTVTQSYYDVLNIAQAGYVSHSFNQFIQTDGTYVYRVDHGDGGPRAVAITRCSVDGKITDVIYTYALTIQGTAGANATGVSVGGFELSTDNCLIVGNSVDQSSSSTYSAAGQRNIFLSVVEKDLSSKKTIWLTDYTTDDGITPRTPQLVKLTDDHFLIMWEEYDRNSGNITVKAVTVDGDGTIINDIYTVNARLSDCQPIVTSDGLVQWYVTNGSSMTLYELNPFDLFAASYLNMSVENTDTGVQTSWEAVTGAVSYKVYRKDEDGAYALVKTTTDTSWLDTSVKSGVTYTYQVYAVSVKGRQAKSEEVEICYVMTPEITSVSNISSGIQIIWDAVDGATHYYLYYKKESSSSYSYIEITAEDSNTISYTISASSGYVYNIYVKAYANKYSSEVSDTVSHLFLKAPTVSLTTNTSGNVLSWSSISGAESYVIYRKTVDSEYAQVAATTDTSWTDATIVDGVTYTYQVYAYANGVYSSGSTEKSGGRTLISDCTITLSATSYTYDGSAKTPTVTVKNGSTKLTNGTHYTVTYSDNVNAGTATVTVTGTGAYAGTATETFTIRKATQTLTASITSRSISYGETATITASGTGTITYTSADTSIAAVNENGVITGTGVGTTTITVTASGNDNYDEASKSYSVSVSSVLISAATVTFETSSFVYNGTEIEPAVTVIYGDEILVEGTDYTISYSNNINAGTGRAVITGMGNFRQTVTKTFTISKADAAITASDVSVKSGEKVSLSVVSESGGTLSYASSNTSVATVSGTGEITGVSAGTASITITSAATANYNEATKTITVTVEQGITSISSAVITLGNTSYSYDGTAKKPSVTVKLGSVTLTNGTDYTVSYSNNTNAGTATVTITGMGNYIGTIEESFTISKASQTISVKTSGSTSIKVGENTTWTAMTSGDGAISYSTSDSSIATVSSTGKVTAKGVGTVKIYATAASTSNYNASSKTLIATITIGLKTPAISSVTQSGTSVTVKWSKITGATGYYVYRSTSQSSGYSKIATITSGSTVSYKDTASKTSGKTYYYKVYAYSGSTKSSASSVKSIKYMKGTVSSLTNVSSGITVKWSKVSGATGYYIYRKAGSGSYSKVKTITSGSTVSWTDTAVKSKNGTTYTYYVQPYNSSSKGAYATKKTVRLTAVSISSLKNSSSKMMTVKWAKNSKATGYQIQYSTSSSFASGVKTVTVSSASTVSKVISSLTKGKTYYVRIRVYKTVSGTKYYSAWSSKKSVKISK